MLWDSLEIFLDSELDNLVLEEFQIKKRMILGIEDLEVKFLLVVEDMVGIFRVVVLYIYLFLNYKKCYKLFNFNKYILVVCG